MDEVNKRIIERLKGVQAQETDDDSGNPQRIPSMKLETSEEDRERFKPGATWFTARLLRDIDTLLAEVERLRATPPAPPLPVEVEEMRKAIEAYLDETANPGETLYDGHPKVLLNRAASLLSRWPGVWRPIETAPKDGTEILLAANGRGRCYRGVGQWSADDTGLYTAKGWFWSYAIRPTHWSPLPEPPMIADEEHDWFKPDRIKWVCCRKCGIVRRADEKNSPCRGVVRVDLRQLPEPPHE